MGSYCAIGSVKGQLLPVPTLKGKLSIPPYTHCSHDEYEGEYTIVPGEEQIVLATANKLLTHDIVVEPSQGVMPPGFKGLHMGRPLESLPTLTIALKGLRRFLFLISLI